MNDDDDKVSNNQSKKTKEEYTTNTCENQIDKITKTNNKTRNSMDIDINSLANNNFNDKESLNCFKCVKYKKNKKISHSISNIVDISRKQSVQNDNSKNDGAMKNMMNNEYSKNNCIKLKNKNKNTFCSRFFSILQQLSCHDNRNRERSIDDKNSSSNEKKNYLNVSASKK
jgi:hypothetical protein